ncbi:MAG: hypothetical protein AABY15_08405 [Nanoarchaeota archaeon]
MKVMYSLIGLFFIIGIVYVYVDEKEEVVIKQPDQIKEPENYDEIIVVDLRYEVDFTPIYEGEEAIDWFIGFLNDEINDDQFYQKLVAEDIRYLNASNSTFAIKKFLCNGICSNGGWLSTTKEIMLFNESNVESKYLFKYPDEQVVFTYLHETGHMILDTYADELEREEWIKIHNEISAEELREYARTTYHEDFADSYAMYRLGVLHSEERLEFIKRIEKKAGVMG